MQADADVGNIVLEELPVRRRPLVDLQHQRDKPSWVSSRCPADHFQAYTPADRGGPVVKLGGLEVQTANHLNRAGASTPQLGASVKQLRRQCVRLTPQDPLPAGVES